MRRGRLWATVVLVAAVVGLPAPAHAVTLTVNSTADPGDGVCNAAECTLREAIVEANATPGADVIEFDIPAGPFVIQPTSALPSIDEPVTIDATTQTGWAAGAPVVELDGSHPDIAGTPTDGLQLDKTTTVRGLVIHSFPRNGIQVGIACDGCVIAGNFIGTDPTGLLARPNGPQGGTGSGISVRGENTLVGGSALPADRNVISGNAGDAGVLVLNVDTPTAVENNYIGVGSDGSTPVGNSRGVFAQNTLGTRISGNVISDNGSQGVRIAGPNMDGVEIEDNKIGTDDDGAADVGNGGEGVLVVGGPADLPFAGIQIEHNTISGNASDGVSLGERIDASLLGNRIGTTADGTAALPNGGHGIVSASSAIIGEPNVGNVISGNGTSGIDLSQTATATVVQGNKIGTNLDGTAALPNGLHGIHLHGPVNVPNSASIGGPLVDEGNVISGNGGSGVFIDGLFGTSITGNKIGIDEAGTTPVPNDVGVTLKTDEATVVGNRISGNTNEGVAILNTADRNVLRANEIGVGAGNGGHGVLIEDSDFNLIGGTGAGQGNTIVSNADDGVAVTDNIVSSDGNAILGNSIHGNGGEGIDLGDDGHTPNDGLDNDGGPNGLQNFPVIEVALSHGDRTFIAGTLETESSTTYRLEFFSDDPGEGQGKTFLGAVEVTTAPNNQAEFSLAPPVGVAVGDDVTGTATRLDIDGTPRDTSEFSTAFTVPAGDVEVAPFEAEEDDDILCGTPGNDVFLPHGFKVFVFGGDGNDTISHADAAGPVTVDLTVGPDILPGEDLLLDVENVTGSAFDDVIRGDGGANVLRGLGGDDKLVGGGGGDRLVGGAGDDRLLGGPGPDVLIGGSGDDILRGGAGADRLVGNAGADKLFGGPGPDELVGGGGDDALRGQRGPDDLRGGPGDDFLNGGPGADVCLGGSGNDTEVSC